MNRRHFLRRASTASLAATGIRLMAAERGTPRVLIVFLRGAYDAASLLVPIASSFYYEQRPHIAVARPGTVADAAIPLDSDWGLHPALIDTMQPLFDRGQLAFVPFAGTDDVSRIAPSRTAKPSFTTPASEELAYMPAMSCAWRASSAGFAGLTSARLGT